MSLFARSNQLNSGRTRSSYDSPESIPLAVKHEEFSDIIGLILAITPQKLQTHYEPLSLHV